MNQSYYLTCQQLLEKYPDARIWGWDARKIGTFYSCLLLEGRRFGSNSRPMISEISFSNLMNFVRNTYENYELNEPLYSYEEIMELFPQAAKYRWTPTKIGQMRSAKLLMGLKSSKENRYLIARSSADQLIRYTNQIFLDIIHGT